MSEKEKFPLGHGLWYFVTTTSDRKRTIIRLNG